MTPASPKCLSSLGNGSRISFWKDVWCGEEALSLAFPNLFRLSTQKNATAVELWDRNCGERGWNPFLDLLMTGKWRRWIGFYKFCIEKKLDPSWRTKSSSKAPGMMLFR